jgi:RNA polymerase sigma-70 factor (ECF subfamily)
MTHLMTRATEPPPPTRAWSSDDAALLLAAAAGDVAAQERFWRAHVDVVYRVCAAQQGAQDAEDATSETFLAAFSSAATYDETRGSVQSWLLGIAVNQVRRGWRTDRRIASTLDRVRGRDRSDARGDDHADAVIARTDATAIRAALAQLPDADRLVLVAQAAGDLDTEQLARALRVSPNAAKVRLHRARARLAALLDPTPSTATPR